MDNFLEKAMGKLTGVTVIGMVLAAHSAFIQEGIWGVIGIWIVYLAGGVPAGWRALRALWKEKQLDIDFLMVLAAIAAAVVGAPLEGAVLLTLFSISTTLEHRAMGRARHAVEALMALRPETALRQEPDGKTQEVSVHALLPGDIVILRPGAQVPVDGVILEGEGTLNEATITGESMPVHKRPGAKVFEATVNLDGILTVEVLHSVADSTVAKMISLVTQAQSAKAPSERFSTWFGQRYTIGVLLGSVLAFFLFLWLGRTLQDALYRTATLLVAASPCAIVISVPAAILSALAAAARGGVLFKGGEALEILAKINIFAFDKTGTLTTGQASVIQVKALIDQETFLSQLAGLEEQSEHSIAAAIRRYTSDANIPLSRFENVRALPSKGIISETDGETTWAGNARLAEYMGADIHLPEFAELQNEAQTVVYLGKQSRILGAVSVADQPRETSRTGLRALRQEGVEKILMMTGDRLPVALHVSQALGIEKQDIYADLLPEDKVRLVGDLTDSGRVAFVGDGVNDAAALARADVGIAMGAAGSDVALQAADIALLSEDMGQLAAAHNLARRTRRVIQQNLFFAMGAMVVLVISSLFFELPLPLAVVGHEGGTLLVVLNGLRLLKNMSQ